MATVDVIDSGLQADSQSRGDWLGLRVGGHPALRLYSAGYAAQRVHGSWSMGRMSHFRRDVYADPRSRFIIL